MKVSFACAIFSLTLSCVSSGQPITFDWAVIGDPGNSGELTGSGAGGIGPDATLGGVDYHFRMSKHEVTNVQYTRFLNAVAATDTYGLYSTEMGSTTWGGIIRGGSPGDYTYSVKPDAIGQGPGGADGNDYTYANKPVVYVSFFDAMRFVNWLENGQPRGAQGPNFTEEGVYSISDGFSEIRDPNAMFFIPSEDEWYKAAYYNPNANGGSGIYYDYPTATDSLPNNNLPSTDTGNSANYYDGEYTTGDESYPMTDVGAYTLSDSPYGTFDQGGNVWEWNESNFNSVVRGIRGGRWDDNGIYNGLILSAPFRNFFDPMGEAPSVGFRVATTIPESASGTLALDALCMAMGRLLHR